MADPDTSSGTSGRLVAGSVGRHLLSMTLPMTAGLVAVMSKALVDAYFVGQLGPQELSALGFALPVTMVIVNLAVGLGIGTSAEVARAIGSGDRACVLRRSTDGLLLSVVVAVVVSMVGLASLEPLFRGLGASESVLGLSQDYMRVWYAGVVVQIVPMIGGAVLRAAGDARGPGLIIVASAIFNALLDPLLIFGGPFVPPLGVEGAALATVLSNILAAVGNLWLLHRRERLILWRWPELSAFSESVRQILHVGLPAAATNVINPLGLSILTALLARFGPEVVAGFSVGSQIQILSFVPIFALTAAVSPIVGQNFGAARPDRVKDSLRIAYIFAGAWCITMACLLFVVSGPLVSSFSDSELVRSVAATYLRLVPLSTLFYGFMIVAAAVFNALRKPMLSTSLAVVRTVVLMVPIAWMTSSFFGWMAVFWGIMLANVGSGVLALYISKRILKLL